ncbi:GAP family protein [Streptomyces sp. NPDC002888]|uniref:GAP family protein n=1 Tax=Streptomyces sp. NPDC002888 TaxID=3364668 RepID=UPI00367F31EE
MVLDLLLIALAIVLDPLPLMAFVLVVASARGVWKGLAFILGWLACFVAVIALVLTVTGGRPPAPRSSPSTVALVVKLVIGVSLVLYGAHRRRRLVRDRRHAAQEPSASGGASSRSGSSSSLGARMDRGSVGAAAVLAVLLQPWGLVAAGAVTVVEANTSHFATWLVLFSFCLLATASLLAAELYVVCAPEAAQRRLLGLRTWMEDHQEQAIVVGSLVIGLWLTGKSIYQLTTQ